MSKKTTMNPIAAAIGTAFVLSVAATPASAEVSPFGMTDLDSGYMQIAEGKCGAEKKHMDEGKCGGNKTNKMEEGKCGGDKKAKKEGKCGEAKCGAAKKKAEHKAMEEGKCGGSKKNMEEGKCGGKK